MSTLFDPASVAIVGASDNRAKTTARPLAFLRQSGWDGRLYPINPVRETVLGERAWPSLRELPEVPEHVFVLTGADAALETLEVCAELGVGTVSMLADGFAGTGSKAAARRERLQRIIAGSGTRVLGPSTLGIVNVRRSLFLTANAAFAEQDITPGGIFVASQSGSVIGAIASRGNAMGIGFAGLVSTGSELDLTLGEICSATLDDPSITSYALFLESLQHADHLRAFAAAAAERGKSVLAYKLGRSEAAAQLSVSHSGALAGNELAADLLLRDLGIGRVTSLEALLEGQLLAEAITLPETAVLEPRVAVVSTTGGGGAMVVDCLSLRGAAVVGPSAETAQRLREIGVDPGHGSLVDLTLAGTRYDIMKGTLEVLQSSGEFDVIVAVPGSSARFHPELAVKPIADAAGGATPLAAFVVPEAPDALRQLRAAGVAAFRTPESCADAVIAGFARRRPIMREAAQPAGIAQGLDEVASYELLSAAGVTPAPYAVLAVDEVPDDLPVAGPVVVKAISDELPHKTDAGGVVLGVTDVEGLATAIRTIVDTVAERAGIKITHVLVQSMVSGGIGEVLVGLVRDPDAGPMVVLASGGILAEILGDRSARLAPVTKDLAWEMIRETRSLVALDGYRGRPRGDLDALADAVVAISQVVVTDPSVVEAEVNPLIVQRDGVVAVDAMVRRVVTEGAGR
ncbi:acetate--CoA ligase family protein [Streptomyces brasiliensis]|uniref:6-carboxyhexanoate--CoA ligase n=1 Tax=Streptomyces brasiliensis TaxID=1954 RepID=A0A917L557_9ACTN|nr:acetate--CoA ligase family protein [Streptomyces brasiliensis]GGJ42876.1 6-carboxyhexanoate--CoA ligase [Streptomyces brasiliensis]